MNTILTDNPLSQTQTATLATLASMLIPASEKYDVPGADDVTIMGDIIGTARQYAELFRDGLDAIDTYARGEHGKDFVSLSIEHRQTVVDHFQNTSPHFIRSMVSVTVQCYYRDTRVMESLGMAARAPYPEGFELPLGDWTLLDPVKERGAIWRKAD